MTNWTKQERFWRGDFGDRYTDRNQGEALIRSNVGFFRRVLRMTGWLEEQGGLREYCYPQVVEFGANRGLNLQALNRLDFNYPYMTAVEINASACIELLKLEGLQVFNQSMFVPLPIKYHLVISSGVLIHVSPDDIERSYFALYDALDKPHGKLLVAEYFSAEPREVTYRGCEHSMWTRNFGKELLELFTDLRVIDYGFVADFDTVCPRDNITWWLLGFGG